ncbi:serine/threonine protein kinase [Saccharopolyspora antimicrobica]|uniref:non-specific serine/threonine protein kinase n=1 Tax=Saccharopolyspora antimicrobica TaxID=455193 RepID=A0A1I5IYT2_9PSEU|nr:serine/threonine-protein kinase [Saccharopolyspora antimicrobica]RKT83796.1 serine/threonine-protein kinase [Saccharopolyspora antimicrobica]SFO65642.1 serine/threonine protein kinase [Saccharopolyspora antimicrobica]
MSEDLTGKRLGHYKIDGVLGRGGMSVMYRATDVRLGRKVALKVMGEHITGDAEFRERFVDEARNTSAIDHANIVPLYDFGEVDGMLFIAMRLVDGSDLASLIKDGPISPKRTLELLSQISEALDMLHERGLVHLDLKPANVLVTSRESVHEHVYLADFGLTRRGATGHRTSSGDFLGSPTYAAPEHLRGEPVDGRTDQYALACMLFACLTGRPPFQGQVQEVIQGHLAAEPPPATSLVVLPAGIDEVLRRGMAKKADQRFSNCQDLVSAARAALGQAAGDAPPQPRPVVPMPGPQPVQYPPSQPIPAQGYRPPYPQQPPRPLPPPSNDPVRLRPPMPAGSSSFATTSSSSSTKWIVLTLVGVALVLIVVVFIVMASSIGGSGSTDTSTTSETSSYNSNDLPTTVPTGD